MTYSDGDKYIGYWLKNEMHGSGTYSKIIDGEDFI
jgi:hypothetical protein